jgi:O-antigen ligase
VQRLLLFALIAASYLLFAGAPRWTLAPLLALALAATLAAPRRALAFEPTQRALDVALAAIAAGLAVQAVLWPRAVAALLSPHGEALRASVGITARLSGAAAWTPLSIDAMATWFAAGNVVLAALTFWIARGVFGAGGSVRTFCRVMAAIGAAAALVAVLQRAATPQLVLGVLTPDSRAAKPFGAFVNRNHFAGWLMMIVPLVSGYLVAHTRIHLADEREWRGCVRGFLRSGALLIAAAVVVMTAVLALSLSRSALLGIGAAAVFAWIAARPRLAVDQRMWPFLIGAAGLGALAVFGLVDLDAWAARIENTLTLTERPDSRLVIWRETLPLVRDFWAVGTGGGTYSTAMLVYQQSAIWIPHLAAWAHFNQAHNHYLHVAAEGGLLVGAPVAAALAALGASVRRSLAAERTELFWIRLGAAAALVAVAAQSLWEIPLVMPANAVLVACLAAVAVHERHDERHRKTHPTGESTTSVPPG